MITFEGTGKIYRSLLRRRSVAAIEDLSLTIRQGEVFGVAGPNGAGKSTLISLLLGFLEPTAGLVRIAGMRPRAYVEREGVAYLPELVAIPPRWTVDAALRRFATLAGLPPAEVGARAEQAIEDFGLAEHRTREVRQLSKGTLQRLGLAQALIGGSDLVILDEPTHGLDPVWTARFRDIVRDLRRPSRAILIASHNLDELERVADRVAILHRGRLQRVVQSGTHAHAGAWRLTLAAPNAELAAVFPGAEAVPGRPLEFRVRGDLAALNAGLSALIAAGGLVTAFGPEEGRLESEFRAAVEGDR
ncbi:MAG: ABC transporter ATP-binding protein [Gemmatimonadota bacterium]